MGEGIFLGGTWGVQDILLKECYELYCTHIIETNQLICSADQLAGFFILISGFSNFYLSRSYGKGDCNVHKIFYLSILYMKTARE